MTNNTDMACLFIILFTTNINKENFIHMNKKEILSYFPAYDFDRMMSLGKELLKQLDQPKHQKYYNDIFRGLPFEQRYRIGIESRGQLMCTSGDLLGSWYRAYNSAVNQYKWFDSDEIIEVEKRIKAFFDQKNEKTWKALYAECADWTRWESAKDLLFVNSSISRVDMVRDDYPEALTDIAVLPATLGDTCVLSLRSPDWSLKHFVSKEEICLWGVDPEIVWAKAKKKGVFMKKGTRYVRDPQEADIRANSYHGKQLLGVPEKQWKEKMVYNRVSGFDDWIKNGMKTVRSAEKEASSSVKETAAKEMKAVLPAKKEASVSVKETTEKKSSVKSAQQFLKSMDGYWKKIDALMLLMYRGEDVRDQDGRVYSLFGSARSRKSTFKKNSKDLFKQIKSVEEKLIAYAQAYENARGMDNAFEMLCAISDTLDSLERCVHHLRSQFGLTYQLDPKIEDIKSEYTNHYSDIIEGTVKKEIKRRKRIEKENKDNHRVMCRLTKDITESEKLIKEIEQTVETYTKKYDAIVSVYEGEKRELEAEIGKKGRAAARLHIGILDAEQTIAEQELDAKTKQEQIEAAHYAVQKLDADHAVFLKRSRAEESELQDQIGEAEETMRKSLFFKKQKQQRVEELKEKLEAAVQERKQEEENYLVEKQKVRDACETCSKMIAKAADVVALEKEKTEQLSSERKNLLLSIEKDKEQLKSKQDEMERAKSALEEEKTKLKAEKEKVDKAEADTESIRKKTEDNEKERDELSTSIMQTLNSYPTKYEQNADGYTIDTDSDFAFSKNLALTLDAYCKAQSGIRKLRKQIMYLNVQENLVEKLKNGNLLGKDEINKKEEISEAERQLKILQDKATPCYTYSDGMDLTAASQKNNGKLLKKAEKSFGTFWSRAAEWRKTSESFLPEPDGQHCLNVSEDYYLCFNPFYVIGVELCQNKKAKVELFRYSDLTFELDEQRISLEYGKECPKDVQIIAERWKHETLSGAPNRRYTNNPSYYVVSLCSVKLSFSNKTKVAYYSSVDEAAGIVQAFDAHKDLLFSEYADVVNQIFTMEDMPDIAEIAEEAALLKKKEEADRKEQERLLKQRELEEIRQREEEKRKKEQRQKELELWADTAQKNKEADEKLVRHRLVELDEMDAAYVASWDNGSFQPVTVSDKRRTITNGIIKVEFVQAQEDENASKYLAVFTDASGKRYSDIRSLERCAAGEKTIIPFEIKTQESSNPAKLYLLIRDFDTGKLVGRIEYKLNIAFTNDFDF